MQTTASKTTFSAPKKKCGAILFFFEWLIKTASQFLSTMSLKDQSTRKQYTNLKGMVSYIILKHSPKQPLSRLSFLN